LSNGDRNVLLALYQSTGGASWNESRGWGTNNCDFRKWFGVTTNEDGRVVELNVCSQNLIG
ncbi:unnamed protein product, partial [Discosporangium mesarthrocarpum]